MTDQTESVSVLGDERVWQLQLAYHPVLARIGARAAATELALGRSCSVFGPGIFDDVGVSREHAQLRLSPQGQLLLEDRGSRNGSFVNGTATESARLHPGDIVGVGRLQFLVLHERPRPDAAPSGFVADSGTLRGAWGSAETGLRRGNVLVWGPRGAGKRTFARALAATREQRVMSLAEAFSPNAPSGVWLLERVLDLDSTKQRRLLTRCQNTTSRIVTVVEASIEDCRARLDPELFEHLAAWPVHVAPLRERRADVMPLVLHLLHRYGGEGCAPTPELVFALLRHRWPGNVAELESVLERAVVESEDDASVGVFSDLRHLLSANPSARDMSRDAVRATTAAFRIARDGTSFQAPDAAAVDISRRAVLARMLAVFVENHQRWPARVITVPELVLRCWPGERMKPEAGSNRVYVALAALRKLGLRDVLVRDETGYLLDPNVPIVFD